MTDRPTRKADVTRLLKEWQQGRNEALDLLLPIVYGELRRMARMQLSRERKRHTLQPTELVHEAFVRLVDQRASWQNRLHFYGIAARCMRRILVDHARRRQAARRPPAAAAVELDKIEVSESSSIDKLLAVDEALERIAGEDPRQAQVAELKFFAGLEKPEIAALLGVSEATVGRDLSAARKVFAVALKGDAALRNP